MGENFKAHLNDFLKRAKDFITKYANPFCILALILFCHLFCILNLGNYRLIDIDETRYVNIARAMFTGGDYITPYLNFEPFLEKPPLFYWFIVLLYKLTGSTGEFVSRLPNALMCIMAVFATYFFGKKALNSKIFGLTSAFILLSSVWVGLFTHLAIMDIGFMALCTVTIYCAVVTLFNVKEENKKYLWYLAYFFMGLSVLQKGLIGIIIPVMVTGLTFLAFNKGKELVKPLYIIPGVIIFLLVAAPWHIAAYTANGSMFFEDYIVKHHFARFLNSSLGINRKQPFIFYVPVILAGFMPWVFSFISACIRGVKSLIKDFKAAKSFKQLFSADTNDRKLLVFASIYMLSIFLFFSISSTKLPTYVLPLFPALSLITGYYWWGYITDNKFEKGIKISTVTGAVFFILFGTGGALITNFLSGESLFYAQNADGFRLILSSWLIVISLITILCLISKNRPLLFIANVILMLGVSIITSGRILGYVTTFGQNELEHYADRAQIVSGSKLIAFGTGSKYSLLNNYEGKVYYVSEFNNSSYNIIKDIIKNADAQKTAVYLITKKKKQYPSSILQEFTKLESGNKYDLYVRY